MFNFLLPALIGGGTATAAAISGGAALAGAALSRRQAKRERANHFVNLRASAQRGGFNPLSVLNATGGGGYNSYASFLSRSPMEAGLNAAANAGLNRAQENRTVAHEINMQDRRQAHESILSRASNAAFAAATQPVDQAGNKMEAAQVVVAGNVFDTDPDTSDAAIASERWGEGGELVAGPVVAYQDWNHNMEQKYPGYDTARGYIGFANTLGRSWTKSLDMLKSGEPSVFQKWWNDKTSYNGNPASFQLTRKNNGMTWLHPRHPDALRIEINPK